MHKTFDFKKWNQFTEENKKDRVSSTENWWEENIDTSAGASVDWGKQGDTDSYADFICGIDGTQKKWNKWSEIQWCRYHYNLPDIHFHQLRNTYATILLKNSFNSKGVSHLLGHAKEIISVDVYGDTQEIIEDCLDVLEPFIEEVIPKERKDQYYDYSEMIEIDLILEEYFYAAW